MKKIVALLVIFLLPATNACIVRSDISLKVDEAPPIPLENKVTINANLTFSWGFGAIIPLPVNIYIKAEGVPDWLDVSIYPDTITISPFGLFGGEESKNIQVQLYARKETEAYVLNSFTLHAYTNGSFLVKGSEATTNVYVMEDYMDREPYIQLPSAVNMKVGETKTISINITNRCNAPIYLELIHENTTGFSLSYKEKIRISPKATEPLPITIKAEKVGNVKGLLKFIYYPIEDETRKNEVERYLELTSRAKPGGGGAIAVGLIIVIIGIIVYVIWKKKF